MNDSDRIRLRRMLDAAREAPAFVEGKGPALSLVKEIEIIGEAATKISAELKQATHSFHGSLSPGCVIG